MVPVLQAISQDSCVPDAFAQTGKLEAYGQANVSAPSMSIWQNKMQAYVQLASMCSVGCRDPCPDLIVRPAGGLDISAGKGQPALAWRSLHAAPAADPHWPHSPWRSAIQEQGSPASSEQPSLLSWASSI